MRLLIVDDHAVVRRGVRELLSEELAQVEFEEEATGEDAVARLERETFDLVILDISLPRRGGMEALKDLRARKPAQAVLVLSQHSEEQYAVRALRAGACGYLTKDSPSDELVRAVKKILGGGKYVSASLAERLAEVVAGDRPSLSHSVLSDRELQVLRMLAGGRAVKEISRELALSDKTVSTYRTRILSKMGMHTNAELMRYALRHGLAD
jgi:two-component system invasion response regulator UvrY